MGSFVFKWDHPAEEVYVTGTFDDWSKSEKLVKQGNSFSKDVRLPSAAEKIYYKFVVDGNWVTDHTAPQENDASGNLNNVLTTDRIVKHTPATAGIMSGVTPTSTTASLAKDVPLEKEKAPLQNTGSSELPGAFPETPGAVERKEFSVNPLPAADGAVNPIKLAPGEKVPDPSTFTNNTITSTIRDDPELVAADKAKTEGERTFSVNPLPAFAGAVNPVKSTPGEKIPEPNTVTRNTIDSSVTTDKETYEKSGGLGKAPVLPPVITPAADRISNGTGVLDMPPAIGLIPESSLPMGSSGIGTFDASPTIQSVGPSSTTAELAAAVPLESAKVPEIVKGSQEKAHVEPEASAIPEEVKEKSAVEKELLKEVPVAPSTSEGTAGKGTDKSEKSVTAGEAAAAIGGAALAIGGAATVYASGAASNLPDSVTSKLPESVQKSIASINAKADTTPQTLAQDTPEIVKESIAESGQAPEAAANEEAVLEKKAVEKELLSEVKPETSTGDSAPKIASSEPKSALAAPAGAPAAAVSRDVSPGTVPGSHSAANQTALVVTTGIASATTDEVSAASAPVSAAKDATAQPVSAPAKDVSTPTKETEAPSTPSKDTPGGSKAADSPGSVSTAEKKKKNRLSFFGKIKAKLHKDKEPSSSS
ncbi:hypothetical protein MBM_05065 [Drepanopeziza brunnea f. sp. 'multigermtubi' MB_m1]|uniref:AMP-activated protein kinase glycogen-binding domain-containing protein n=1 Tax=Marssonina brunnea f. sp. multigermtubi (strain MB_m1) TaxID=1072389 RepID=K1WU78_MARBU|nr:uncharacterized protein MBM_05065 [Drepanopeziza brunnea f. sp. 'multigermtubi' MB_m1]EKD16596.1 hypothetical protein MBM_05065 [Drepanopeziza brunnea f. sp. 'multigermtubi' MB_m1]